MAEENDYSDAELIEILRKTYEKFGALYPVLVAPDGKVLDGKHRVKAVSEWPRVTVDWVKSPADVELLRLISNWIRREVSQEEKTQSLARIAELTKWPPKVISDTIGIPYRTLMRYLPDEYKERPGAGGPKERVASVATQEKGEAEELESVEDVLNEYRIDDFNFAPKGIRDFIVWKLCKRFGMEEGEANKVITGHLKQRGGTGRAAGGRPARAAEPTAPKTNVYTDLVKYYPSEVIDLLDPYVQRKTLDSWLSWMRRFLRALLRRLGESEVRQTLEEMQI